VCWILDVLFNGLQPGGPRLLFKGGTSLSKGFGLIERFSEDIDITVFREDIGEPATVEELESISGKKRAARLDAIRAACQGFINATLRQQIEVLLNRALKEANLVAGSGRIESDPEDPDQQSLLLWYPTVTAEGAGYIRRL
jgi:Nucleotidyl transferase AbiEii toxin, Type IV TA system